jgi:hypothetical protein
MRVNIAIWIFWMVSLIAPVKQIAAQLPSDRALALPTPTSVGDSRHSPDTGDSRDLIVRRRIDPDSTAAPRHYGVVGGLIGGVLGGAIGLVAANAYARNHRPPCGAVPDGGPCRRLGVDHTSADRIIGVGLGGLVGAAIGYVSAHRPSEIRARTP